MAALEIRLAPGKAPVDLSVRVLEPHQAREIAPLLPPASSHVSNFLRAWAAGAWRPEPVGSVWLELDLDREPQARLPDPLLCLRICGATDIEHLVGELLPRLNGLPLTSEQRTDIRRICSALPISWRLLYVFSLRPRLPQAIRLEFYGTEGADLAAVASRLSSAPLPTAGSLWEVLAPCDRFHLSVDVGPCGLLDGFGVEASIRRLPHADPRWERLFEEVAELCLMDPGKRPPILVWPGQESLPPARDERRRYLVRSLSHIKVRVAPGRSPEAKVYLLLTPVTS